MTGDLISPESEEFGALFRSFAHSVFRLETLQVYRGQRDLNLLSQFLEGKPRPPDPAKALWTAMITSNVQEGKAVQRVHVTIEPLTDYLRFELTWGPTNPNAPASRLACGTCGPRRGCRATASPPSGSDGRSRGCPGWKRDPTEDDIRAWIAAAGAGSEVVAELLELLKQGRIEYATWRHTYQHLGGASGKQISIAQLEAQANRIRGFQPAMVIGLLQTPAYARELLSLPGSPLAYAGSEATLDEVVAQRMIRQQALYQPGKQVQLVIGEAALHNSVGTLGTLLGQLDRLMTVTALPSMDVGIVPFAVPMLPVPGFVLYDDNVVTAESLTTEQRLIEPDEVAQYVTFFDHLHAEAATGPDAAALIQQVAAELRGRPVR